MMLLLSGEGPSDIGTCDQAVAECEGGNFKAGPMALLIDQIVTPVWNYSPKDTMAFVFVSEGVVATKARQIRRMVFPGLKQARETGGFFNHARALAQMAKARETPQLSVGAVLFRDSDGTCSAPNSLWQEKWSAIMRGFTAENFEFGVPMVPKPKSEVWLLCALQEQPYANCARFEAISGNDASPNSAKKQLDEALKARGNEHRDVWDMIENGTIQAAMIQMPSFDCFHERLVKVARMMRGLPDG
jgi:hypothetical protein